MGSNRTQIWILWFWQHSTKPSVLTAELSSGIKSSFLHSCSENLTLSSGKSSWISTKEVVLYGPDRKGGQVLLQCVSWALISTQRRTGLSGAYWQQLESIILKGKHILFYLNAFLLLAIRPLWMLAHDDHNNPLYQSTFIHSCKFLCHADYVPGWSRVSIKQNWNALATCEGTFSALWVMNQDYAHL